MAKRRFRTGCLTLLIILAVLIAAAVGFVAWQGSRAPKGQPDYVALGSSYAAGAGLGALQKNSPILCARSVGGYPQQLVKRRSLSIVDMSCGGAVTKHVLSGGQFFQGPQIRAITPQTRLVTLTVGGNDIGYVGDLSMLAARHDNTPLGWIARHVWKGPKPDDQRGFDQLQADLTATLRAIKTRAPNATVVVATYPTILPPTGTCDRLGLTVEEADRMRRVGDRLAQVTRTAAETGGATVVDMHALGAAHHACSAQPWTTGWKQAGPAPFHPTLAGAKATAAAISEALAGA